MVTWKTNSQTVTLRWSGSLWSINSMEGSNGSYQILLLKTSLPKKARMRKKLYSKKDIKNNNTKQFGINEKTDD